MRGMRFSLRKRSRILDSNYNSSIKSDSAYFARVVRFAGVLSTAYISMKTPYAYYSA